MVAGVAILHPREVWATGIASLVRNCDLPLIGCWSRIEKASLLDAEPDLILVARSLLDQRYKDELARLTKKPNTIIVLEPDEALGTEDLRQLSFEGLLISDAPVRVVETCLRAVLAGHAWIDPFLVRWMSRRAAETDWSLLSNRELEVANLAASGLSNKRIARALNLSDGTVKMHMHHILAKLHLERRGELAVALTRSGGSSPRLSAREDPGTKPNGWWQGPNTKRTAAAEEVALGGMIL